MNEVSMRELWRTYDSNEGDRTYIQRQGLYDCVRLGPFVSMTDADMAAALLNALELKAVIEDVEELRGIAVREFTRNMAAFNAAAAAADREMQENAEEMNLV